MNVEERAAAYFVVSLLEGAARRLEYNDILELLFDERLCSVRCKDELCDLHNLLVHYPNGYSMIYRCLNRRKDDLEIVLTACCEVTGMYNKMDVVPSLETLLKFYKLAKE